MTTASGMCCCISLVCVEGSVESNPLTQSPTAGGAYMIEVRHGGFVSFHVHTVEPAGWVLKNARL
uniref:Uncharacterized protein n=2 Tax=Arion vulgaris TaxID=1028688 RepID=A0A0B7AQE7_9EUPU